MPVRFALIAAVSVSAFVSAAAPALAQDNTTAPPSTTATTTATPPVKEKKICESDVDTGSIMAHRTCHTKSEWAEINKQNAKDTDQFGDANRHHSSGFGH